jgi:hypothetical protein
VVTVVGAVDDDDDDVVVSTGSSAPLVQAASRSNESITVTRVARDDQLAQRLEPGETLVAAAGAIVARRRRRASGLPRRGFILAVTDKRLVAFEASTWRVTPLNIITSWSFDDGVRLVPAPLGRARLLLPDRSVVTLAPYGGWTLRRLAT